MATYAIIDRNAKHGVPNDELIHISNNKKVIDLYYQKYINRKFIPIYWNKKNVFIFKKENEDEDV